tara:strand:- start:1068 stop:2093 length:1026 start_codon:yes stop_codon:yes gene_type:complete
MAQAQNFRPSQDVSVHYQVEATPGTRPDNAGLKKLQATSFTIPEASVPVEYSSARSGQYVTTASQGHHSEGTKLWTFDTTLRGTPDSVLLATLGVFEDGSSEAELNNTYSYPVASYRVNSPSNCNTYDIRFHNAGAKDDVETVSAVGCVATGFTLSSDIGSEGGELVCTINWATGFKPTMIGDDLTSGAYDTGTPKNIRNLHPANTYINDGSNEEIVIQSFELSVQRTIERIHYADNTSGTFAPFGYAMTGGLEVTGTITAIRNEDIYDLHDAGRFRDSNTVAIKIGESTAGDFTIDIPKAYLNEPSIDNGGAVLMETIPFTAVGADDISSASKMLGIQIS